MNVRSLRGLLRDRAFSLPAIGGLALAIGATTTVFSVFSAMLLRPMGLRDTGGIVALWATDLPHGQDHVEVCYSDLLHWRKATAIFEDVALASSVNLDFPLLGNGPPEHVDSSTVSGNFFQLLGATPLFGRLFGDEDDQPGAPIRIVLSHRLWQARFGGDRGVIGRQLRLGSDSATVIGVARPEFDFPLDVEVWVPLRAAWPEVESSAADRVFRAVARLKPGITPAMAQAGLAVVARQAEQTLPPGSARYGVLATPILDEIYGAARPAVLVMLGAVGLVLLIACANVASLLLSRGMERGREIAIRFALGASRGRIARLLLGEAALIAAVAGAIGLLLASIGVDALAAIAPAEVPRIGQASVDAPVLAFGFVLTFATVLFFGLAPAVISSGGDPNDALKQAGPRSTGSLRHARFRRLLIAGEAAVAAVLLVGAGLLAHSFANLSAVDPGFRSERVLTFRITQEKADQASRQSLYSEVLRRVRSLPGVESAGAILIRPLSGTVGWDTVYSVEGQPAAEQLRNPNGNYEAISPDYFRTMGIHMIAGRDFTAGDASTSQGVVIVNEGTAKRNWPAGDAVGKHVRLGRNVKAPWLTVVGAVRYREWEAVRPDFYVPLTQRAQHRSDFVVKTHGDPWALAAAVRKEVFAVDKNQPISNVTTMDRLVKGALARARFNSFALGSSLPWRFCWRPWASMGFCRIRCRCAARRLGCAWPWVRRPGRLPV